MTDPAWLLPDISLSIVPPLINTSSERSAEALATVIDQFEVETAQRYRVRDVTGDGKKETFCNVYTSDVTAALSAPISHFLGGKWQDVHDNALWLQDPENKWVRCFAEFAQRRANQGFPSVVVWSATEPGHGHIAVLRPSDAGSGIWISQAGARNYRRAPLAAGFGTRSPLQFFTHD